jgi:thiamine biosynthesis lipoprotein
MASKIFSLGFPKISLPVFRLVASPPLLGICLLLSPAPEAAQGQEANRILIQGTTMGPIPYRVTIANPSANLMEDTAAEAIAEALEKVNRLMSTYKPDSDVSRFNAWEADDWFEVNQETANVVTRSLEISRLSDGAFDITCGPAVNRWKFGPDKSIDDFEIPSADEIESLKARVGYHFLEVRQTPPALKKSNPAVSIDLSAIAKGYAVDLVGQALSELGCEHYMVEVGGELVLRGQRPGGGAWRIGVEQPDELKSGEANEVLELSNVALATSGDYRNYRALGGKRYSHAIDPRTCAPVENRVASVSVIAEDCMTADAVATAVMVAGPEKGIELCKSMGLEVLIRVRDDEFGDKYHSFQTDRFPISKSLTLANGTFEKDSDDHSIIPVFVAAVVVFVLALLGMATGAIFGNKTIKGSCGGPVIAGSGETGSVCGVCSKPVDACPEKLSNQEAET